MGNLEGKVAFVTGAGRGQGRAHAPRLAADGAGVVALDSCRPIDSVPYGLASRDDLADTVRAVEEAGGRAIAVEADVRDSDEVAAAITAGSDALGPIDIVVANAAIAPMAVEPHPAEWHDVLDVNLTGVYNSVRHVMRTPMVTNASFTAYVPAHPEFEKSMGNALPGVEVVDPIDIANAVAWLVSDAARYVTGVVLPVDAGALNIR